MKGVWWRWCVIHSFVGMHAGGSVHRRASPPRQTKCISTEMRVRTLEEQGLELREEGRVVGGGRRVGLGRAAAADHDLVVAL